MLVKTDRDILLQDDAASQVLADMIRKIDPSSVLIPATPAGRSIFSRVAMKLNCGLTADCTELLVGHERGWILTISNRTSLPTGKTFRHHRYKRRILSSDDDGASGRLHRPGTVGGRRGSRLHG